MEIIAAALMISLTLIVVASRGPGKDTSILWASILICKSMLLNVEPVYILVDGFMGARNFADLGANLLLLIGVYFLARAIHRAVRPTFTGNTSPSHIRGKSGLVFAAVSATVCFFLIDAPATSTEFMRDYGGQLVAGLYSAVQYIYIGAVMASAGWTCVRFRKSWNTGLYSAAFSLVGLGCLAAVLLVIDVIVLDALHVLGAVDAMAIPSRIYSALIPTTFLFLCTGLALPPAARKIGTVYDRARINTVIAGLKPVWGQALSGNAGLTLDLGVFPERPDRRHIELHRMIVEIQDSLARDPELGNRIGVEGLEKLARASMHLERQSWRPR
jgi:hypothetical protein